MIKVVEAVLAVSNRSDNKESGWLRRVLEWDMNDPRLDRVPMGFVFIDRVTRASLEKSCEDNKELVIEIDRFRKTLASQYDDFGQPMQLTSTRILAIILHSLATDRSLVEFVNIRSLSTLFYDDYGDKRAREFYLEWIERERERAE